MFLDLALFGVALVMLAWAIDERNGRAKAEKQARADRWILDAVTHRNDLLRERLADAQKRLAELDAGTPGSASDARKRVA